MPNNKEAEHALDYNEARQNQLTELLLNDEDFRLLYKNDIFNLINKIANSNIDDYEDDSIKNKNDIISIINVLKVKEKSSANEVASIISKIRQLFEEALKRSTGIYFYF